MRRSPQSLQRGSLNTAFSRLCKGELGLGSWRMFFGQLVQGGLRTLILWCERQRLTQVFAGFHDVPRVRESLAEMEMILGIFRVAMDGLPERRDCIRLLAQPLLRHSPRPLGAR